MPNRNVFENNEVPDDEKDIEHLGGEAPAFVLPALDDGHKYVFDKLPSGKIAILTEETTKPVPRNPSVCGCAKYQSCSRCKKYVGSEDLDSPESLEERHQS